MIIESNTLDGKAQPWSTTFRIDAIQSVSPVKTVIVRRPQLGEVRLPACDVTLSSGLLVCFTRETNDNLDFPELTARLRAERQNLIDAWHTLLAPKAQP